MAPRRPLFGSTTRTAEHYLWRRQKKQMAEDRVRTTRTRNLDTPNSNAEKRETCLISTRRHIPRASLDALLVIRPLLVNERVAQLLLHFDISRIAAVCRLHCVSACQRRWCCFGRFGCLCHVRGIINSGNDCRNITFRVSRFLTTERVLVTNRWKLISTATEAFYRMSIYLIQKRWKSLEIRYNTFVLSRISTRRFPAASFTPLN